LKGETFNIPALRILNLSLNKIIQFNCIIYKCKQLQLIYFEQINLYQLNWLETLDLSQNKFQIIPLNFGQVKSLKQLDLRGNPFYKWHLKQIE